MSDFRELPRWQQGNAQQRADIETVWHQTSNVEPLFLRQFCASMAPFTEALRRDMEALPARLGDVLRSHRT
jgi:hypothetical protein